MTDINHYLDFVLSVFFAFGISFEIPVVTVLLVWINIISIEQLKKKRPYIVLFCFIAGMFLTPPDVFSQTLLAIPMWLLYEAGIFIAVILKK